MIKCRRCRLKEGTEYYDGKYNKTKKPVCRECLEALVKSNMTSGGLGFYRGPGKDPEHEHNNNEHVDAQDWWDRQTRNIGEEE